MSDENIKGIPEEETTQNTEETPAAEELHENEQAEEAVADINENEEVPEAENDAVSSETNESNESEENCSEESEDAVDSENLCPCCGEREKSENSDYCTECEAAMLSRKIPFLAWAGGLIAVVFSVFALALVFLLTAPSLQVAKADAHAREKRWYHAYTEYSEVASVVEEITSIMGGESPFVQTGSNLSAKMFDAVANYVDPLEAFYYQGSSIMHLENSLNPKMKNYFRIYNDYMSSYEVLYEGLNAAFGTENPTAEEMHKTVESFRGTEGVNGLWIDDYHLSIALNSGESDEICLEYFKKIDESAKKTGLDYSWLYYSEYADFLYRTGDYESSVRILDDIIKNDKTNFSAYELKMRVLLKNASKEESKKLLDEFKDNNEGLDTAYILEMLYLRSVKEYDKALELCNEAMEEYGASPELNRQKALIYLLKGDYDSAYESAYNAFYNAEYIASYSGDNSLFTNQLINTTYVCTYYEIEKGSMTTQNAAAAADILSNLESIGEEETVKAVISGEKTIEQILTEGDFDLV